MLAGIFLISTHQSRIMDDNFLFFSKLKAVILLSVHYSNFIENIVFPFSLTSYLPKKKKSDKRKEKEVSITFGFYCSLQIKNM